MRSMALKEQLIARFGTRNAHVAVIGLGYVGLPLAVAFAEAGYCVTGIDLDRLVDAGAFISAQLGRKPNSRVATAILNKRAG